MRTINLLLKSELVRFIFSGLSAVATDFTLYEILSITTENYNLSKGTSFVSGTLVAFLLNKYFTFKKKDSALTAEIPKFIVLYTVSLTLNIALNKVVLDVYNQKLLAFLIATAASTVVNYIGQKYFVFVGKSHA